jgi:hypothetical protein
MDKATNLTTKQEVREAVERWLEFLDREDGPATEAKIRVLVGMTKQWKVQ